MKLKAIILSMAVAFMAINFTSCSSKRKSTVYTPKTTTQTTTTTKSYTSATKKNKAKKLPPGQAKKVYGDKSARKYAPGQNKG